MRRLPELIEEARRMLNPGVKLDASDAIYAAFIDVAYPETDDERHERLAHEARKLVAAKKAEPTATQMLDALPGNIAAKAQGEELRRIIDREHARCSNIAGAAMREAKQRHRSSIEKMMPGATEAELEEMVTYAAIGELIEAD